MTLPPPPLPHYRAVFISDIHLGAVASKAGAVQAFLQLMTCDNLYLVGDIIDGWVGRRESKWTQPLNDVLETILAKSQAGTVVRYTPGNHDSVMRRMNGRELGNIHIDHSFEFTTMDGKDFLVVHGDLFDHVCTDYKPLAFIGAWMNEYLAIVNATVNKNRIKKGRKPVDFTSAVKKGVKKWVARKTSYEAAIVEFARESGFDGVVCGHVHRPRIETFEDGFVYINCGDWVEHCTAIAETEAGHLILIEWPMPKIETSPPSGRKVLDTLKGLVSPGKFSD